MNTSFRFLGKQQKGLGVEERRLTYKLGSADENIQIPQNAISTANLLQMPNESINDNNHPILVIENKVYKCVYKDDKIITLHEVLEEPTANPNVVVLKTPELIGKLEQQEVQNPAAETRSELQEILYGSQKHRGLIIGCAVKFTKEGKELSGTVVEPEEEKTIMEKIPFAIQKTPEGKTQIINKRNYLTVELKDGSTENIHKKDINLTQESSEKIQTALHEKAHSIREEALQAAFNEMPMQDLNASDTKLLEAELREYSRRDFLKATGAAGITLGTGGLGMHALSEKPTEINDTDISLEELEKHHESLLSLAGGYGKIINSALTIPLFSKFLINVMQNDHATPEDNLNAVMSMGGNFLTEGIEHGFYEKLKHWGMDHGMFAVVLLGAMGGDKYKEIAEKMGWDADYHFDTVTKHNCNESLNQFNDKIWENFFINMFSSGAAGIQNNEICLSYADALIYRESLEKIESEVSNTKTALNGTGSDETKNSYTIWIDNYNNFKQSINKSLDNQKLQDEFKALQVELQKINNSDSSKNFTNLLSLFSTEESNLFNEKKWDAMNKMIQHARMLSNVFGAAIIGDPPNILLIKQALEGKIGWADVFKSQIRTLIAGIGSEAYELRSSIHPALQDSVGARPSNTLEGSKLLLDDAKRGSMILGKGVKSIMENGMLDGGKKVLPQIGGDASNIMKRTYQLSTDNNPFHKKYIESLLSDDQFKTAEDIQQHLIRTSFKDIARPEEGNNPLPNRYRKKKFLQCIGQSSPEALRLLSIKAARNGHGENFEIDQGEKDRLINVLKIIQIKVENEGYDGAMNDKALWSDLHEFFGSIAGASLFLINWGITEEIRENETNDQKFQSFGSEKKKALMDKILNKYSIKANGWQSFEEFSHDILPVIQEEAGHGAAEVAEIVLPQMWFVMGMLPGITAVVKQRIKLFGLETGAKLSESQFEEINLLIAGPLAILSSVADNLAMYMISEGVYGELEKDGFIDKDQYKEGCKKAYENDILYGAWSHLGGPASVVFSDSKDNPWRNGWKSIFRAAFPQVSLFGIPGMALSAAMCLSPTKWEIIKDLFSQYEKAANKKEKEALHIKIQESIQGVADEILQNPNIVELKTIELEISKKTQEIQAKGIDHGNLKIELQELVTQKKEAEGKIKITMHNQLQPAIQETFLTDFPPAFKKVVMSAEKLHTPLTQKWSAKGNKRRTEIDTNVDKNVTKLIESSEGDDFWEIKL